MELSQTKQQKQELGEKINQLTGIESQLENIRVRAAKKDDEEDKKRYEKEIAEIQDRLIKVSAHRLKLLDEFIRLSGIGLDA